VAVPEASVDKNEGIMPSQLEIRPARKPSAVDPVAEASGEETVSDEEFRLGTRAADSRHDAAALLF